MAAAGDAAASLHDDSAYNKKTILYVGGLDDAVTESSLHAAFLAFGEIVNLHIPVDAQTKKARGFGFVEYEDATDAAEAMDNMNDNEFFGKVLKVNVARPDALRNKAVWAGPQADRWYAALEGKPGLAAPAMIVKVGADGKPIAASGEEHDDTTDTAATATANTGDAKDSKAIGPPPGLGVGGASGSAAGASKELKDAADAKKAADAAMAAEAEARREAESGRSAKKPRLTTQEKRAQKKALKAEAHSANSTMKPMSARELGLDFKFK